jgi:hypothetical protein
MKQEFIRNDKKNFTYNIAMILLFSVGTGTCLFHDELLDSDKIESLGIAA